MYLYSAAHFSIVFTFFFFFNDTATTEIYTLSLHDALPISKTDALDEEKWLNMLGTFVKDWFRYESHLNQSLTNVPRDRKSGSAGMPRPISYAVFCLKKKTRQLRIPRPAP